MNLWRIHISFFLVNNKQKNFPRLAFARKDSILFVLLIAVKPACLRRSGEKHIGRISEW